MSGFTKSILQILQGLASAAVLGLVVAIGRALWVWAGPRGLQGFLVFWLWATAATALVLVVIEFRSRAAAAQGRDSEVEDGERKFTDAGAIVAQAIVDENRQMKEEARANREALRAGDAKLTEALNQLKLRQQSEEGWKQARDDALRLVREGHDLTERALKRSDDMHETINAVRRAISGARPWGLRGLLSDGEPSHVQASLNATAIEEVAKIVGPGPVSIKRVGALLQQPATTQEASEVFGKTLADLLVTSPQWKALAHGMNPFQPGYRANLLGLGEPPFTEMPDRTDPAAGSGSQEAGKEGDASVDSHPPASDESGTSATTARDPR